MATKMDIVEELAAKADLTKKASSDALNGIVDLIAAKLKKGEKVTITGFGTFVVRNRAARTGRNPQTGAPISIPAQKTPAFRAGSALKGAVR